MAGSKVDGSLVGASSAAASPVGVVQVVEHPEGARPAACSQEGPQKAVDLAVSMVGQRRVWPTRVCLDGLRALLRDAVPRFPDVLPGPPDGWSLAAWSEPDAL